MIRNERIISGVEPRPHHRLRRSSARGLLEVCWGFLEGFLVVFWRAFWKWSTLLLVYRRTVDSILGRLRQDFGDFGQPSRRRRAVVQS